MIRRAARAFVRFFREQQELRERMLLRNRPWEQEFLHWSGGELHGHRVPPGRGRVGVTKGGWCVCSGRPIDDELVRDAQPVASRW